MSLKFWKAKVDSDQFAILSKDGSIKYLALLIISLDSMRLHHLQVEEHPQEIIWSKSKQVS